MCIGGIQKTSTRDYPRRLSTVLFTRGCNMRCPYCHNAELLDATGDCLDAERVMEELNRRKHLIDAVVFSGGECTLWKDLPGMIRRVRQMGYLVKLDTNGTHSGVVESLLQQNVLDYVAMDVKAPPGKTKETVGISVDEEEIWSTADLLRESRVPHEFRITLCQELTSPVDVLAIGRKLQGSRRFVLQNFRDGDTVLAGKGRLHPYPAEQLHQLHQNLMPFFREVLIRE